MSLLSNHLEQISLSSESIATLPFPSPKIFTNALLSPHDITALIRDTEPHERALFSVPPPPPPTSASHYDSKGTAPNRRQTVFNVTGGEVVSSAANSSRGPRRNTAVAAVLGSDLNSEIRKNENPQKGDIDVEILLKGAEKLGEVYIMDGVKERIAALRSRHGRVMTSIAHYESKVARQTRELERMNRAEDWDGGVGEVDGDEAEEDKEVRQELIVTDDDLRMEEEEIRELERKRKELEDRVSGMERDLGGLLR